MDYSLYLLIEGKVNNPQSIIWAIPCCLLHMHEAWAVIRWAIFLGFSPYVIPSPHFVCADSNGPEEIAHVCRLDQAIAACIHMQYDMYHKACKIISVGPSEFGPSRVTYQT